MEKSLKSKTTFLVKKKLIYIFLNCYVQSKKWKLYICTISYLEINKSSISNLICRLLSLVFFSCNPPYKCPAVITQHIWVPFAPVSFSPLRIYPVGNFHLARQRRVPYFQGKKIQVRLQEMKSTTFCTPKHCMWREAPPRFLLSFLNFFLFSQKAAAYVLKRDTGSSMGSIQFIFELEIFKKLFYLKTDENTFFRLDLSYVCEFLP